MDARQERIILSLVKQYAPQLLGTSTSLGSTREERLERLCRRLANNGVLLLTCEVVGVNHETSVVQTQNWISGVARMYSTLAKRLFPSYARLDMQYIDSEMPAVVIATGDSNILMQKMAGFVLPYLAARTSQIVSEAELRGLVDILLEELEASDLPRADYQALRVECVTMLQQLLTSPVRLMALKTFDRPIFFSAQDTPATTTGSFQAAPPTATGTYQAVPPAKPTDTPSRGMDAYVIPPPRPRDLPKSATEELPPRDEMRRRTGTFAAIQPDRPNALPETGSLTPPPTLKTGEAKILPRNPTMPSRGDAEKTRRPPVPPLPDDKK